MSVDVRLERDKVWLTQDQMSKLFDISRATINAHIKNIFRVGELPNESNVQKMHIAQSFRELFWHC